MWLLTETPWLLILFIAVLSVVLLLATYAQQRRSLLYGVGLLVLLSGGILVIEHVIVTENERVETAVMNLTSTFQKESQVYELSSRFRSNQSPMTFNFVSNNAKGLQSLIEHALVMVNVEDDVRITDVKVTMKSQNSRAITHFRANATISFQSYGLGRMPTRWELTWQREAGDWKVIKVRRLHVITGEDIGVFDRC